MEHDTVSHPMWQVVVAATILAAGLLAAVGLIQLKEDPRPQKPAPKSPMVNVYAVRRQDVPIVVHGSGSVRPRLTIQVTPQISGTVVAMHPALRAGGFFTAKDILMHIDETDFKLAVVESRANLDQATASLANAAANVNDFEARLEEAQLDAIRVRELISQNSTTQGELDRAELAQKKAEAQLIASRALKARAAAVRKTAEAKVKFAEVKLARTRLSVPFDGRVISEQVEVGQFVVASQSLASVYATNVMEVIVPLADRQLAWFEVPQRSGSSGSPKRGAQVKVLADFAGKQRTWNGHVAALEGLIDPTSRMASIVVEVTTPITEDADRIVLMPGMFVQVEIEGSTLHDVIALPRQALRIHNQVWIVQDHILHFQDVQVIRKQRNTVYVRGLKDGQWVVNSALDVVVDGMKIRIPSPNPERSPVDADASG